MMHYLTKRKRYIGFTTLIIALVIILFLGYEFSPQKKNSLSFSSSTMLNSLWQSYTKFYLDPVSYRTVDPSRNSVTTSEGQSYSMLRAVWIGDKTTFDREWSWTQSNLARPDDHLFSWLYGQRTDGTYGIITKQNGQNTASDADSDIALALVMAYSRWQDPQYLTSAQSIIGDIWDKEVVTIQGVPYLAANDVERISTSPVVLVNPSYLSPYAYRVFAKADPTHPWNTLVDSSYIVIGQSMASPLNASSTANLPPDWVAINRTTGAMNAVSNTTTLTTNFGYDAIRTPWRLALDWEWNKDQRAKDLLGRMSFLSGTYSTQGKLIATYAHDGSSIKNASSTDVYGYESASMYGATIGYFIVSDPVLAKRVYNDKLLYLFDADTNDWKQRLAYYDDNWAWFGIALYNNALKNLPASIPDATYTKTP